MKRDDVSALTVYDAMGEVTSARRWVVALNETGDVSASRRAQLSAERRAPSVRGARAQDGRAGRRGPAPSASRTRGNLLQGSCRPLGLSPTLPRHARPQALPPANSSDPRRPV